MQNISVRGAMSSWTNSSAVTINGVVDVQMGDIRVTVTEVFYTINVIHRRVVSLDWLDTYEKYRARYTDGIPDWTQEDDYIIMTFRGKRLCAECMSNPACCNDYLCHVCRD